MTHTIFHNLCRRVTRLRLKLIGWRGSTSCRSSSLSSWSYKSLSRLSWRHSSSRFRREREAESASSITNSEAYVVARTVSCLFSMDTIYYYRVLPNQILRHIGWHGKARACFHISAGMLPFTVHVDKACGNRVVRFTSIVLY